MEQGLWCCRSHQRPNATGHAFVPNKELEQSYVESETDRDNRFNLPDWTYRLRRRRRWT